MRHLEDLAKSAHGPFRDVARAAIQASNSPEYLDYWCSKLLEAVRADRAESDELQSQMAKRLMDS